MVRFENNVDILISVDFVSLILVQLSGELQRYKVIEFIFGLGVVENSIFLCPQLAQEIPILLD